MSTEGSPAGPADDSLGTASRARRSRLAAGLLVALTFGACFERGDRWLERTAEQPAEGCDLGTQRCTGTRLEACTDAEGGPAWSTSRECGEDALVCSAQLGTCALCEPGSASCDGGATARCRSDGSGWDEVERCDDRPGLACRDGACRDLCAIAAEQRSNVGCTVWAVDLDNAALGPNRDAAAQQFAVVVSNPQPDVRATVRVFQDDAPPGTPSAPHEIASADVPPLDLRVFKLGPREVDGSTPGVRNDGTHTALSRAAYRITSNVPIVAYQFNPLENVDVFSNDASQLVPQEALGDPAGALESTYVVASWPQTIAITDDPNTNFDPGNPTALRAFLTLVGTRESTAVRVTTTARVVPGGPVAATPIGGVIEAVLGPFEVLNLETDDFNADFTGTLVEADGPIATFVGTEASDAPHFERLSERRCCADHLEEQLAPTRTAGRTFVVPHSPSRTTSIERAGAEIAVVAEPDFVRIVATTEEGATVLAATPSSEDVIVLDGLGDFAELEITEALRLSSSDPLIVAHVMASQDACGVRRGLPGGDPSLMFVPPLEQARSDYVFLTPDQYAFDFVSVTSPAGEVPLLDGVDLETQGCTRESLPAPEAGGAALDLWSCQLSFPRIDDGVDPIVVEPGEQNDGVHRVASDSPIVVIVWGFDSFVSYAYAGGTDLREIAPPR